MHKLKNRLAKVLKDIKIIEALKEKRLLQSRTMIAELKQALANSIRLEKETEIQYNNHLKPLKSEQVRLVRELKQAGNRD